MKLAKKTDIIVIAAILLVALAAWLGYNRLHRASGATCEIWLDGELARVVDLGRDGAFSLSQKPEVVFEVKEGRVAFVLSDCPDKVCVHSGFLGAPGQTAACLPNRLILKIAGLPE